MKNKEFKTVAAIDIGSSGLRLLIADVFADGSINTIEEIKKTTSIGRDSFTMGKIAIDTIKEICLTLNNYQRLLQEYQVDMYRAVATSGLREAENRDYILDQIRSQTGLEIEIINNAEERYLAYKAIKKYIPFFSKIKEQGLLIVDIGSGGVEISVYNDGYMKFTDYLKAGSLRLSEILADLESISLDFPLIMEEFIENKFHLLEPILESKRIKKFIGLGGESRIFLKLSQENTESNVKTIYNTISREFLQNLYSSIMFMTTEQIGEKYSLNYKVAKILLPSVIIFNHFLNITETDEIIVPLVSIRHGLIVDMLDKNFSIKNNNYYTRDIISSVRYIGRKYQTIEKHAEQVEWLALTIFDLIKDIHKLGEKERLYLQVAAILHDVGKFIDHNHHAFHSYNIIATQDIMGFSDKDLSITANIVRFHEEENPQPFHESYDSLDFNGRIIVSKLVAILKLANSLDISYKQKAGKVSIIKKEKKLIFKILIKGNFLLEKWLFMQRSNFFERVFGYKSELVIKGDEIDE